MKTPVYIWVTFVLTILVFIWSLVQPKEYDTWVMEALPGVIGAILIAVFWNKFRLSNFLLVMVCLHACVLFIGAKYTYAEVPFGFLVKDLFGLSRNHYDRLGHFMQGFAPAFLAREILIRNYAVNGRKWLFLFVVSICLAFSALYELIEFAAAVILDSGADAFLGTQGDPWDTQKDMLWALIGALSAFLFAKFHDASIKQVDPKAVIK